MKADYCIIGLGNPGKRYEATRHNFGFLVIDKLAKFFRIKSFKDENDYAVAFAEHGNSVIALAKPMIYMNNSGQAVKQLREKYEFGFDKMLIVYDDVNIDFGTIRIRPSGSDGGQNGMKSIIYELETNEFPRLRMGIRVENEIEEMREKYHNYLAEYVLNEFSASQKKELDKICGLGRDAVQCFLDEGIKQAMNNFNKNFLTDNNTKS